MFKQPETVEFSLPDWVNSYCEKYQTTTDPVRKMRFVNDAARENILQKTGGPFAAAIFEAHSGKLISLGVNLVTTQGMSILHAEMVAISLAQKKLGSFDLGNKHMASHELVSTTEPCAMCLGATLWSGVRRVITGATDQDARSIGFDEGPKPADWIHELTTRGIMVQDKVERESALEVLVEYNQSGGAIYNSRED